MTTILDVLKKGALFLEQKGLPEARLNMEIMVAHELQLKRMELYLRFEQPLSEEQLTSLREKLKQRGQRVPLQHITGTVAFGNYEFRSDARALIPRPETEELVDLVKKQTLTKPSRILDVGCGSGVLGLTLAKDLEPDCSDLTLVDLSSEALSLTRENANFLKVEATILESDLFSNIEGSFDLIVANLPYIAESERENLEPEVQHDPAMALYSGADGLDLLRLFCSQCADYLNPGGIVALEVGYDQGKIVTEFLNQAGLNQVSLHADLNGILRFPIAQKR